jgi:hypothetical protein
VGSAALQLCVCFDKQVWHLALLTALNCETLARGVVLFLVSMYQVLRNAGCSSSAAYYVPSSGGATPYDRDG